MFVPWILEANARQKTAAARAAAPRGRLDAPGFGGGVVRLRYFFASPTSMRCPSGSRM
jgi:hypothetical protein